MATIELSVNTSYVPSWGLWEGLREILQNARDVESLGGTMEVKHLQNTNRLKVVTTGFDLTRESLLLGATTKPGQANQLGQFGEGYKLALLALTRIDVQVTVHTYTETWTPDLLRSASFGGAQVLAIKTRTRQSRKNTVEFIIDGVDAEMWERVKTRVLWLGETPEHVSVDAQTRILTDEAFASNLYVGGIYVGRMPERYRYGYDLRVDLDRDRKMADPWSLRYSVAVALNSAVRRDMLDILDVLKGEGETHALAEMRYASADAAERVAKSFKDKHGDDAVPVADMETAAHLRHHAGMNPVIVEPQHLKMLESVMGLTADRLRERNLQPRVTYGPEDISSEEMGALAWATAKLREVVDIPQPIQVVEFYSDDVAATHTTACIRLGRHLLSGPRARLLSTLAHEVAHNVSSLDGSQEHVEEWTRILAEVAARHG